MVARCLAALESLRADDIANTVPSEEQRSRDLFLGISGDVGADDCQAHAETKALEIAEPQRD
jgi:hypothetical protein